MSEIITHFRNEGVPLESPTTAPTIRIRRTDTQALVVTDQSMTEQGDGAYSYTFAPSATLEYSIRADGNPLAVGQTTAAERYAVGSLSGITTARIETDLAELHLLRGLVSGSPLTVTPASRVAGAISQTISGDGINSTTVTRS